MKRLKKKQLVSLTLAMALMGGNVIPSFAMNEVSVSVSPSPDIDIVLTVGNSVANVSNFEKDIKRELQERGIANTKVNIQAMDTVDISTESEDAYSIFSNWTSFPFNAPQYWRYDQTNKWVTTDYNQAYETGFIDQTEGMLRDFKMKSRIQGPDLQQPVGFVFRVNESEKYAGKWDMYYLWTSHDGWNGKNEKVFTIFKVEGQNLDYKNRPTHGSTYSATPLMRYGGTQFGWPYHTPYDYGGYPNGTPYKTGVTVTNIVDSNLKTTTLAIGAIPKIGESTWYDLELDVKGDQFKVKVNGEEIISVIDDTNPYMEGYYGIFSYSHVNPKFKEINIEKVSYRTFNEVLREPEWRDDTLRLIVNLNDYNEEDFTIPTARAEILTRLLNEEIHYVGWGTNLNKEENQGIVNQNNGNGLVVDNVSYEASLDRIADYIKGELSEEQEIIGTQYVVAGEPLQAKVNPSNVMTGTNTPEYPNGKWKYNHKYNYYENDLGQSAIDGQYQSDFFTSFDKPGKYEIFFENRKVKEIYAHRKPVASFNVDIQGTDLTLKDTSFDVDMQSSQNKGIVEREWKWKEATANTWTNGMPPSTLEPGREYLVQLRVKDSQGAWSDPSSKYISTSGLSTALPVAEFTISQNSLSKFHELEVNDNSYDPSGVGVSEKEWTVTKKGVEVYKGGSLPKNFNTPQLGEGVYSISLKVRSGDKWSHAYSRPLIVTNDIVAPEVEIDLTNSDWAKGVSVNLEYSDQGGSGFKQQRYVVSTNSEKPTTGWSSWSSEKAQLINIQDSGRQYIHLEAEDIAGNKLNRRYGTYDIDNLAPTSPTVIRQGDKLVFNQAQDILSGLKIQEYSIDSSEWEEVLGAIDLMEMKDKEHIVRTRAIDNMNNVSEVFEYTFTTHYEVEKEATATVSKAENTLKEEDISMADNSIAKLPKGEVKDDLTSRLDETKNAKDILDRINDITNKIQNPDISQEEYEELLDELEDVKDVVGQLPDTGGKDIIKDAITNTEEQDTNKEEELKVKYSKSEYYVRLAEGHMREAYITKAKEEIAKITGSKYKAFLTERIETVEKNIFKDSLKALKNAEALLAQVREYQREPYFTNAEKVIQDLKEEANRLKYSEELQDIREEANAKVEDKTLEEATRAIESAEKYKTPSLIRKATQMISKLEAGAKKDDLLERINNIK